MNKKSFPYIILFLILIGSSAFVLSGCTKDTPHENWESSQDKDGISVETGCNKEENRLNYAIKVQSNAAFRNADIIVKGIDKDGTTIFSTTLKKSIYCGANYFVENYKGKNYSSVDKVTAKVSLNSRYMTGSATMEDDLFRLTSIDENTKDHKITGKITPMFDVSHPDTKASVIAIFYGKDRKLIGGESYEFDVPSGKKTSEFSIRIPDMKFSTVEVLGYVNYPWN